MESPDPSDTRMACGSAPTFFCRNSRRFASPIWAVDVPFDADARAASRKSSSATMLMLSRFISETICDCGGDGSVATFSALAGVFPAFTVPSKVMPTFWSAARSAPAVNRAGSSTTSE